MFTGELAADNGLAGWKANADIDERVRAWNAFVFRADVNPSEEVATKTSASCF